MAKKKESLTPEERLQAALVPESEQPYKLPENWCWTRLGEITEIIGGGTPSSNVSEYYSGGTIPWISPADLSRYTDIYISKGAKNITELGLEKSSAKMLPTNTVCLSSRAPIGYVVIAENPLCTNQGFKSFLPAFCYLPRYLYWYLKGNKERLESYASGTTFLELSASKAGMVEFPLATLAEQQRIVDRIESLFAKLDEAKQKAQEVLDSFEIRKAAILHKAFTGELTAQWRKEHGVGMESWTQYQLRDILDVRDGTHDSPVYFDEGFPLITSKNLKDGKITTKDLKFISKEDYEKINERSKVDIGDILFAMIGTIGNPVVVEVEPKFAIKNVALFKNIGKVSPYFIKYFLESKEVVDQMEKDAKGSTQRFVPLGYLRTFNILLPKSVEQSEIVRLLDDLLAKEQQAKEAAQGVLEQIDLIKKSILARAFRGELGTNDPTEESAISLIKEVILTNSNKRNCSKVKRSIRPKISVEIQMQLTTSLEEKVYRFILENPNCTMEQLMSIEKDVLNVSQALWELQRKSLILKNNNTLTVVI